MGADSKIAWTDHTFNPWWGCQRVSAGCEHCYAETFANRLGLKVWGAKQTQRRLFGPKHWDEPLRWAEKAASRTADHKPRVFCASMADIGEDRRDLDGERDKLSTLIVRTAGVLDWLLLTKRIETLAGLFAEDVLRLCWVGTTAENQDRADERIPHLLATPAAVRFVSCEPLLGLVRVPWRWCVKCKVKPEINTETHLHCHDEGMVRKLDWVIVGGESGPKARASDLAWHRSLRDQCKAAGVAFFEKQLGAHPFERVDSLPLCREKEDVLAWMQKATEALPPPGWTRVREPNGAESLYRYLKPAERAGADPSEWPEDLRVREFPR